MINQSAVGYVCVCACVRACIRVCVRYSELGHRQIHFCGHNGRLKPIPIGHIAVRDLTAFPSTCGSGSGVGTHCII